MENHTIQVLRIKNGPNGTSLFIVNPHADFSEVGMGGNPGRTRRSVRMMRSRGSKMHTPTMAPITKEDMSAMNPYHVPKSHPIPSANFTSPYPIQVPRETNHKNQRGSATNGPEAKRKMYGNHSPSGVKRKSEYTELMRASAAKLNTH